MSYRLGTVTAGVLMALAVAAPSTGQGKSGGKKPAKTPAPPPSTSALTTAAPSAAAGVTGDLAPAPPAGVAPFAWLDDATIMDAGNVWLGISMVRWHGSGASQTIVPVVDGAVGISRRLQVGASVPRVAGGFGTMFAGAKYALLDDESHGLKVAVAPTLEIQGGPAPDPLGPGRAQWGLPFSAHIDRALTRYYGSSGYFSPGIWYAGAGIARSLTDRAGASVSFSRAWTSSSSTVPAPAGTGRTELSGGASYQLTGTIAAFGSIGRTLGVSEENGAGTTLGIGVSLAAAPALFTN